MTKEPDFEHSYDHLVIAAMAEPFPALAEARNRCPVAYSDQHGGFWALFRHEDIGAAARDPLTFSSASGVTIPAHAFPIRLPPIETDPPQHMQYRGSLLGRFAPGVVAIMEPKLRAAVQDLIAAFIETGRADLATQLTQPLPAEALGLMLNMPEADRAAARSWTMRLIADPTDVEAVGDAIQYAMGLYHSRDPDPDGDLAALVLSLEIDGRPIQEDEFLCTMMTLINAGLDTTANAAANMLELLSEHTELRDRLRDEPALLPAAIEELLRYITPLPSLCRTATSEVELGGQRIASGERVQLNWIAANHDPDAFANPEVITLDREHNRHFAFGTGPHRCLGAHLARLELRILLEEVLRCVPDFTVDTTAIVRYAGITRGISSLPCTFTPRPASSVLEAVSA